MKQTSADLLEFESLRELVGRYVGSQMGRSELENVSPQQDRSVLERDHALNAEAVEYLKAASKPQTAGRGSAMRIRFTDLPDPGNTPAKLRIEGSVLEGKEIFDVLGLIDRASDVRMLLASCEVRFPLLAA